MSYNYSEEYRNYFYETNHTKTLLFCSYNMNISVVPGKGPKIENRYRWKSSKSYSVGDEATEGTRRYKCLIANSGNKPSTSTTYWQDIGKDEPVIITNENIDKENFEYEMAFNSAKNLCIGSCESARIAIRIRNDGKIPPLVSHENDSYEESILNCYLYFDDNSSTLMYLGMFQCSKDEVTEDAKFRNIEMFDQMAVLRDLDVYEWFTRFSAENPNYTMRQLRDGLFYVLNTDNEKYAYIRMPIDQKEQTLIHDNSTYKYDIDEGTTKLSAGNLLEDICEANGVWGRFARAFDENGRVLFEYITLPALRVPALASEGSAEETYKIPKRDKITKNMRERYVKHDWYRTRPIGKISVYNAYSECLGAKAKGDLNIYDEGRTKKIGEKAEYAIYDNKFFDEVRDKGSLSNFETFLNDILDVVENISYEPYEVRCVGDLVREPGDPIFIEETDDDIDPSDPRKEYTSFKSYIFSRTLKGINVMKDTYKATGDRRMPVFGDSSSSSPYSSSSTNGVYTPSSSSRLIEDGSSYGSINVPELIRNFGFRLLEIQNADYVFDKDTGAVKIFWDDPADIITNEPVPASWAGTIVVRSTDPPLNRWSEGAVVLLDETTRNAHTTEETAFVDDDCGEYNMVYYGIFPYDVKGDYNPFKILKVITNNVVKAPRIISILNVLYDSCDVSFTIPEGNFEYVKLVYKKNSKPGNVNDGTAVDITGSSAHITGLAASSKYYFKIFLKADNKAKSESNTVSIRTAIQEVYNFSYTGGVQAFDTPITGIYKLETWGAQGGDVYTDWEMATKTCSGGRGTYSVGNIELYEGEKLYVCVGGKGESGVIRYGTPGHDTITRQGGYNGGGHGYDDYCAYAAGGGCTHIATATGQLYELSNNKSSVLIVSAGGGGGLTGRGTTASSSDGYDGGGYRGKNNDINHYYEAIQTQNDDQGATHAFGVGSRNFPPDASYDKYYYGGSSGGWYGGLSFAGNSRSLAGSGSSYIANARLTNKCMYTRLADAGGSNRYSSSAVNTKTVQALGYNSNPTPMYMKEGNGYARITYIGHN